jgi:glycosyltransferase involved in cell wall biosynthesis
MDKNIKQPLISILMSVYNGDKYLRKAIESILGQTYKNFEFLIIDDGSTDKSAQVISEYKSKDKRIRIITHKGNKGLVVSLNEGIDRSRGEFVARMDADDISPTNRLMEQIKFMEHYLNVGVCGTGINLIDKNDIKRGRCYFPSNNEEIKATMLFRSPLAHPSVCFRKSVLSGLSRYYDKHQYNVEDYEFWSRLIDRTMFANLHRLLLSYRLHDNQQSNKRRNESISNANKIRLGRLKRIGILPSKKELRLHNHIAIGTVGNDSINDIENWLYYLINFNKKIKYAGEKAFNTVIGYFWLETMIYHKKKYLRTFCSPLLFPSLLYILNKIKTTYLI